MSEEKEETGKKSDNISKAIFEVVSSIEVWQDQFGETCISVPFEKTGIPKHMCHAPLNSQQAEAWIGASFLQKNIARNLKQLIGDTMQILQIKAAT